MPEFSNDVWYDSHEKSGLKVLATAVLTMSGNIFSGTHCCTNNSTSSTSKSVEITSPAYNVT